MPKGKGKKKDEDTRKGNKKQERITRQGLRKERRYFKEGDPEFKSLLNQLSSQGLCMKDVPGDGNCLFRALVDQLGDAPGNHRALRADIVDYMRRHQEDFAPFMEEEGISYSEYLRDLAKDGTYGGNDVIVAFSRLANRSVVIHQPNAPRWEVHPDQESSTDATPAPTAHIAYLNGEHYCSVRSIHREGIPRLPTAKKVSRGNPVTTKQQGTSDCDLGISGISGMSLHNLNGIATVMRATGCEDPALVQQVLSENSYDAHMAIVELLQLMDISGGSLDSKVAVIENSENVPSTTTHSETGITSVTTATSAVASATVSDTKTTPTLLDPNDVVETSVSSKQKRDKASGVHSVATSLHSKQPQRHLSNRERKELAKRERKERRMEEKRSHSKAKEISEEVFDPVGSLAI